jgi:hypothetical protein
VLATLAGGGVSHSVVAGDFHFLGNQHHERTTRF